jgi:hypothetical protein
VGTVTDPSGAVMPNVAITITNELSITTGIAPIWCRWDWLVRRLISPLTEFLVQVVKQAQEKGWTSDEHFTVDGTLLEAWPTIPGIPQ